MADIEIAPVGPTPRGHLRVHPGLPLAALDQHRCVRDQPVAADMIEMKMRVDDEVDLAGIAVDRFEPRADFFAGPKADTEKAGEPLTEPCSGIVLAIGVQPGVEECQSFGCSIRKPRGNSRVSKFVNAPRF